MTQPTQPTLDPAALLATLAIHDVASIEQLPPSWGSSTVWRIHHAGMESALRVLPAGAHRVLERELAAMSAARSAGIPVPSILATGTSDDDRPVMLSSWCPGVPLLDYLRRRPWRTPALGFALGQLHARINATPAPPPLDDTWVERTDDPALEARVRAASQHRDALLHLDLHPLNVLTDGRRITAVLDWANTGAGDPRADRARTISLIRLTPAAPGTPRLLAATFRRTLLAAWARGYAAQAEDMAVFNAWAGAWMASEFEAKLGRPGVWLTPADLAPIRRWSATWARRGGFAHG